MIQRNELKPGWRGLGIAVGMLLALAAPSAAADGPEIERGPTVSGTPQEGQTLDAVAEWEGTPSWQWMRCESRERRDCDPIPGATAQGYTVTAADVGKRLRVTLTVRAKGDSESETSPPTAVVAAAPPTPTPTPSPTPTPTVTPEPTATPDAGAPQAVPSAPAAPAPVLVQPAAKAPTMMRPAPVVHIRGRLSRSGARITLLTVKAPKGARISVRCLGRGCPARRWAHTATLTRVARFQRNLPSGTRLIITVTKPGKIGKHTAIVIRRGKAPARRDRCLMPGSPKPVSCAGAAT